MPPTNAMATTYSPGGSSLSTSGPGYPVPDPRAIRDMEQFAYEMALRRRRASSGGGGGSAPAYRRAPEPSPVLGGPSGDPDERLARSMALRRQIMADEAATRAVPTKIYNGSANVIPGVTMDPYNMSADMRKMFLPANAQGGDLFGGGGGGGGEDFRYTDAGRTIAAQGDDPTIWAMNRERELAKYKADTAQANAAIAAARQRQG